MHAMRQRNRAQYGLEASVRVPELPRSKRRFGAQALAFIRDDCEDLQFDMASPERAALTDADGKSAGKNQIPYNMERDLDRLSFEAAIGRFLASGSREDAFDIYFCYCEIFRPFGAGYDSTGLLLELLSEHEQNASSLLMKHRDHYAHSVYVFLIGLAIYKNHAAFRAAYNAKYGLTDGKEAACHFLEYWGLTSLFHDGGYPFEIAHQQMKAYVCKLDKSNNDDCGFAPYVSYRNMDEFALSRLGDLNALYARAVTERLAERYLCRTETEPYYARHRLQTALKDRAIHESPAEKDYLYMDHAYFSGLMMAKTYLARHREIDDYDKLPAAVLDAFCAILLHNSLFKFTIRSFLHTKEPLRLSDGQPLAYLLMLCDELQCWDRTAYGQNSRSGIFAFDFDMEFTADGGMRWIYFYDEAYADNVRAAKACRDMLYGGYTKKSGAVREGRSKFVDDIDEILCVKDVMPGFAPDVNAPDGSGGVEVRMEYKQKKTGLYLSDSSYLNLYAFALALNGRYAGASTAEEMRRAFEEDLSLEYKLSNIAQAKGFAAQLESIGCFYTDRAVDYIPVTDFKALAREPGHEQDLTKIAVAEHARWCAEKRAMGWDYGTAHVGAVSCADGGTKNDNTMRERTRLHHDLVDYAALEAAEKFKDSDPMEQMLTLIRAYDGLTIYRMR
ncbi:MAG: hypothetical protein VB021_09745 [Oscillospiraceae bacterium]|nr:hypothetical protein [Oscillospiraceae bacterium]